MSFLPTLLLFEGRIATRVSEKVTEDAVMEDAEGAANRGLTIAPRIPGETESRLNAGVVLFVDLLSRSRPDNRQNDGEGGGVGQQVRKIGVFFEGNTIKLIAYAGSDRKIAPDLPRVLDEEAVFVLPELFVVQRYPCPGFVEEFAVLVIHDEAVKCARRISDHIYEIL